ncbi:MAG: cysteine desulfurase-like protein [Deltaproteobacteria bacterium]|jgi:cysteine desulfurase family protein (TIGR01976 family)|nr:cysteine desulfurase-like protein [Deltaproteobacteria bacterium]
MSSEFPIDFVRNQFPGLRREVAGRPAIFFDGPAGSQTPRRVAEAVSDYLLHRNANHGGPFATSQESDAMLGEAHRAVADFVGAERAAEVSFGANMTTLTFALSRALARTWNAGDEIVVSRLDHDANVSPWELAARDAGAVVRYIEVRPGDCTLDLDSLRSALGERTRLVAVGAASNLVGTINPVREIAELAHRAGAQLFVDAVHLAPHRSIDVAGWGCDYLVCSPYKFFGPHMGVLWGRSEIMAELPAYKVRAADETIPDRWMTGTQCHEGVAGTLEAVNYLADLGREISGYSLERREALCVAFGAIERYESRLCQRLIEGVERIAGARVVGITDANRLVERAPTVGILAEGRSPEALSEELGKRGIFSWGGNSYALPLTEALGLEPGGVLRVGLLHYNIAEEVERLLDLLPESIAAVSSAPG